VKVKSHEKSKIHFIVVRKKDYRFVKIPHTSPGRHFDESRVKVKTLGWLQTMACDRGAEFLFTELMSKYHREKIILVALAEMELNFDEFKPRLARSSNMELWKQTKE
jgi:hypothetical protein